MAAAAASAADLRPAWAAASDQPAVSRRLAKLNAPAFSPAASRNNGASWVQPTVSGDPDAASARKRSSSARQSWRPFLTLVPGEFSPHGVRVDWHRVLTRAKQNVWQVFGHGLIKGKSRAFRRNTECAITIALAYHMSCKIPCLL